MKIRKQNTLNPYLDAVNMVFERLKWDLNPESWRSRKKMNETINKYTGQKAVILCNGPSLLKSNFSLLKNTYTFGLNKINLLFDRQDFQPSCVVSVNPFVIDQNEKFYNQTNIPLFLNSIGNRRIKSRSNVIFLHNSNRIKDFARDCSMTVFQGATVTFVALQLAFHMGFQKVALIGCDHEFKTKGKPHSIVISSESDPNHFDPNYFSKGDKWQLPDLLQSEIYYRLANDVYTQFKRKIYNATEGGSLEIFERISLNDFIKCK
jgi:hypothetical protein